MRIIFITSALFFFLFKIQAQKEESLEILFPHNEYCLTQDAKKNIDSLLNHLGKEKINTAYAVSIEGHTDYTGTDTYNLKLSKKRTQEVKKYLFSKGLQDNRITGNWYGEKKPVLSNITEMGRQKNRRVEMSFTRLVEQKVEKKKAPKEKRTAEKKIVTGEKGNIAIFDSCSFSTVKI